ncbi:hypothetical protein AVEN_155123-1 [Araneus ventricosus]|uniref:Uncharacterized protein n=1 Tax=Araneus ventricosus TaxID=182803 RepID=A0A4Y2CV69_ARAVE|nr:hypothetical protein AVEN_155123-1 [Araneus ventricosus]
MNSGDTSNRPNSERRPRIFVDLPPSLLHIAFSFAVDGNPRRYTQSAKHENTGSEHTRLLYSSRNNQERIILNDTEVIQVLPEPTNAIYEPFFDDLPPPLRHIAYSVTMHDSPRRFIQSARHENTGYEHTRVLYSSRNNQERIILNDTEVIHILREPTNAIYEQFSSILEDVVIDDSQSQGNSGSASLNVHYSADNNGTAG